MSCLQTWSALLNHVSNALNIAMALRLQNCFQDHKQSKQMTRTNFDSIR